MYETLAAISNPIGSAELRLVCGIDHNEYDDELQAEALAAIEYLEARTDALLIRRAVTAIFYDGEPVRLRGPNAIVTNVLVDSAAVEYTQVQHGNLISLSVKGSSPCGCYGAACYCRGNHQRKPVTVTYTAGYATLPALVRQSIKSYVATKYRNREYASQVQTYEIAHGLEAAIRVLNRSSRVG